MTQSGQAASVGAEVLHAQTIKAAHTAKIERNETIIASPDCLLSAIS